MDSIMMRCKACKTGQLVSPLLEPMCCMCASLDMESMEERIPAMRGRA